jgi:transposase
MGRRGRYSPEVRERAVRMVLDQERQHDSQWAAICSIASKIGCSSETLRNWVRQAERDAGRLPGLTTEERQRLKELERENRELKRANEILRKASAYFAQAPRVLRGRADLSHAADRPVDVLRVEGASERS